MFRTVAAVGAIMLFAHTGKAQDFAGEEAWKELFEYEGVRFLYVFYPKADAINDGVVLMLQNQNEYRVHYRFTIIFESPDGNESADSEGFLEPLEWKTGDVAGLFWVPFDDERSLGAIGMRNYKVTRIDEIPQS
ncbi:MAG: hypothetical protein F4065_11595 [Rhodothermaceae bacterium]|nr:hypothetical protein [Bacteroidota bacterium]MXX96369.1 hypothetical protein [Rhodothermaceae bacterium]MDE2644386.1 hypothetical protein [Bacteroidota bacterium]MXZ57103.1 hypothetical protein [Rhodothermaceae bacterium]MYB91953.1 hypothetical protein [Rhodothermaceae bacterium]